MNDNDVKFFVLFYTTFDASASSTCINPSLLVSNRCLRCMRFYSTKIPPQATIHLLRLACNSQNIYKCILKSIIASYAINIFLPTKQPNNLQNESITHSSPSWATQPSSPRFPTSTLSKSPSILSRHTTTHPSKSLMKISRQSITTKEKIFVQVDVLSSIRVRFGWRFIIWVGEVIRPIGCK